MQPCKHHITRHAPEEGPFCGLHSAECYDGQHGEDLTKCEDYKPATLCDALSPSGKRKCGREQGHSGPHRAVDPQGGEEWQCGHSETFMGRKA
jgi:hypothetical protein